MKQYAKLQLKRVFKLLPRWGCAVAVLLLAWSMVLFSVFRADEESAEKTRVRIAVAGNLDGTYLSMGLVALESLDSSRYSLEVIALSEEAAKTALSEGDVAAYIVVPDGFVEAALTGTVYPLTYVSHTGAEDLGVLFKDEITRVISEYVLHSQKGVYGAADALRATGAEGDPGEYMQKFSLEYVRLILQRSSFYRVDTLGIADSVGLSTYFFCGFTVVFLLLSVLPFAAMFVHRDHSVGQVLSANGVGALRQVFGEFSALLFVVVLSLFSAVALPLAITLFGGSVPVEGTFSILSFLSALPVAVAVCGMSLFLFECARDTVSGVLLHFFLSLSLCYVGGCFYPVFMFPDTVQALSRFLPTGIARAHLAASLSDGDLLRGTGALCLYGMFFFFLTVLLRRRKLISGGR